MKKLVTTTIVILSVALAMILVGGVLKGITWTGDFNGDSLASALSTIGYVAAMLSGVVLTGLGVAMAVKGECKNCSCEEKDKKEDK